MFIYIIVFYDFSFRASYLEIYNENIADLLAGRSNIPGNKGLAVREDSSGATYVADLKEEYATNQATLTFCDA